MKKYLPFVFSNVPSSPAGRIARSRPAESAPSRLLLRYMKRIGFCLAAYSISALLILGTAFFSCDEKRPLSPDFLKIQDADRKKASFFSFLCPIVEEENDRIIAQRKRLLKVYEATRRKGRVPFWDKSWLKALSQSYDVDLADNSPTPEEWKLLLRRVDTIPRELVLIQAAIESGWGESRFAREGRNYFGEHCSTPGCGIVPKDRPEGHQWEVAIFDSVEHSVRSYIHNLNTHDAYMGLRNLRANYRKEGKTADGLILAGALVDYSEWGIEYVKQVQEMIRVNKKEMMQ